MKLSIHLFEMLLLLVFLITNKFNRLLDVSGSSAILTITDVAHFPPNVRMNIGWVALCGPGTEDRVPHI